MKNNLVSGLAISYVQQRSPQILTKPEPDHKHFLLFRFCKIKVGSPEGKNGSILDIIFTLHSLNDIHSLIVDIWPQFFSFL